MPTAEKYTNPSPLQAAASTSNTEVITTSLTKSNNHDRTSTNTKVWVLNIPNKIYQSLKAVEGLTWLTVITFGFDQPATKDAISHTYCPSAL